MCTPTNKQCLCPMVSPFSTCAMHAPSPTRFWDIPPPPCLHRTTAVSCPCSQAACPCGIKLHTSLLLPHAQMKIVLSWRHSRPLQCYQRAGRALHPRRRAGCIPSLIAQPPSPDMSCCAGMRASCCLPCRRARLHRAPRPSSPGPRPRLFTPPCFSRLRHPPPAAVHPRRASLVLSLSHALLCPHTLLALPASSPMLQRTSPAIPDPLLAISPAHPRFPFPIVPTPVAPSLHTRGPTPLSPLRSCR